MNDKPIICNSRRQRQRARYTRVGLTLIEMLVVIAVTLVFMFALTQVFVLMGDGITSGRSLIVLNGQVRAVTLRLQNDLDHVTIPVEPWATLQNGGGYVEIIERLESDLDANANGQIDVEEWDTNGNGFRDSGEIFFDTRFGDNDDVMMFTARSYDSPFVGRTQLSPTPIESNVAEIVWWTQFTPEFDDLNRNDTYDFGETKTLYRRVFLVAPQLASQMATLNSTPQDFFQNNDISARNEGGVWIPNSMADLTKRENRFAHHDPEDDGFPFVTIFDADDAGQDVFEPLADDRQGDDVMLTRVLGFDVRVFDPFAPLHVVGDQALSPGDPDWVVPTVSSPPRGAYVDLNYANDSTVSTSRGFSGPPADLSDIVVPTYCTWSFHYEHDGQSQDGDSQIDEGTNGLDDDGIHGIDDHGERETSPPYPVPLRGMQVRVRVYEPSSSTVRQSTVTTTFAH